jgi:hypothetical protein
MSRSVNARCSTLPAWRTLPWLKRTKSERSPAKLQSSVSPGRRPRKTVSARAKKASRIIGTV